MTVTFDITTEDTLSSTVARIAAADDERVLLVVPPQRPFNTIELRVLRRESRARGVGLALVTSDATLRILAARVGISTFRNRARAERARWRRLRPDVATKTRPAGPRAAAGASPAEPVVPYGAGLYNKRSPTGFRPIPFRRAFKRQPSPWWATLGLTLVLLVLLGGLIAGLMMVIPAATITVTPAADPIQVTVALQAIQDAVADANAGIVSARALSAQVSGEARIPTSGRRLEPDARATGTVVLINRSEGLLTVPSGTVVATATGNNVLFVTTAEAPLAPNGRATVPIEAMLPGPSGNVRAGTITKVEGPLALSLLVANDASSSGGTLAQVGVVTEEDKELLQALLFDRLKEQAFEQLQQRVEPGSFIPPESVSYLMLSPTFTPFVGEVSPDLFLSMSVQAVGLVVDAHTGDAVAMSRLQTAMPPGTRLISDTVRYIPGSVVVTDERTVAFSITAEGTLLRHIDVGAVRSAVPGMTPEHAATVLAERFPLATVPEIKLGPDWLPYVVPSNLPLLPWRVTVKVDWDTGAALAMQ